MQHPEIELKFVVHDIAAFRSKVMASNFQLVTERTFESNALYDTPERELQARKQLLRIRQYGQLCTLTHKRRAPESSDDRYKTRIETESVVEDGAALAEVFAQLGYAEVFRYEKFRTEWKRDGSVLVLDETPIGTWAELEGPTGWIDAMLNTLGVDLAACITESYGKLFLKWKEESGSPANNLTFEEAAATAVTA